MKIHFLRNATLIVQHEDHQILVDPMLGGVGTMPPFSVIRHKARRNPVVPLPQNAENALHTVTAALITHCQRKHTDHLDSAGKKFLASKNIPTYCRKGDQAFIAGFGIKTQPLKTGVRQEFLGGFITPIPTVHGYGWIARLMGPGVGYFIELPDAPSLYISGDTVLTSDVRNTLTDLKPDVSIVAAGNASLDIGKHVLMTMEEVLEFARLSPGIVVANHLEALNHCPVTREKLEKEAARVGLSDKFEVPQDGQIIQFN